MFNTLRIKKYKVYQVDSTPASCIIYMIQLLCQRENEKNEKIIKNE